ncbi:MAG: hypothetical protein APR62_12105 [Smithella sp. SDB]|nr:MAG: hypothetical protein APR62_12105 [Smithella sp. SDB]
MDNHGKIAASNNIERLVETARFGLFTFQIGTDPIDTSMPLQRIVDAQKRFLSSPLSQVAKRLEQEVLVSSIFSTNTIEGGTLTEEETREAITIDPERVKAEECWPALTSCMTG